MEKGTLYIIKDFKLCKLYLKHGKKCAKKC